MFALVFRFPHGRYHATPWGWHVNEGAVAWPPEPYRILRALIATWHRKADKTRWSEPALHRLIETLAASAPVFSLPDAIHAHTRHYMPQGRLEGGRERTSLVFDAFFRVDPDEELVIAWQDVSLAPEDFALAKHLAGLVGYLGRAESVVIARATEAADDPFPVEPKAPEEAGWTSTDVLMPLTATEYAEARPALLAQNHDKPKSKSRIAFEATVPPVLADALQVETSQLQAAGWSRSPAGRLISYARPEVGPQQSAHNPPRSQEEDSARFQVARFVLAGRPLPPVTDAVKIGEVFRRALMARVKEPIPGVLSGRDEAGAPLRDPQHTHAFFLPEDHDEDGFIDPLVLYARPGLARAVRRAAESLPALWIDDRRARDTDEEGDTGRREWRVALEGFGTPEQFNWVSATPYLRPLHLKGGDLFEETCRMVRTECERCGWPVPEVQRDGHGLEPAETSMSAGSHATCSHSTTFADGVDWYSRIAPDSLSLEFTEDINGVPGPLALGFGCHFGLGLFHAE